MKQHFDIKSFAEAVKMKRVMKLKTGVRQVGKQIGISAATVSRIERELMPDMNSFVLTCNWLKTPVTKFFKTKK